MNIIRIATDPVARSSIWCVIGVLFACCNGPVFAQSQEMRPFETVTLTTEQILRGETDGKPVMLAGELRIPMPINDKHSAVIMIHGASGISPSADRWAQEINGIGVATFILDSRSGRGITNASQPDALAMMVDAYRALGMLAQLSQIDPERIGVMGFSKGAVAALYSSNERFQKIFAPRNLMFAAHIGLYAPCNITYRDDEKLTGRPIQLFHGLADDWFPVDSCRAYVARLKQSGADITLTEYPDATHGYDVFTLKEPVKIPNALTSRNCRLAENDMAQILNIATGRNFDSNDPCMEKGVTVSYNDIATKSTATAIKAFLTAAFRLRH